MNRLICYVASGWFTPKQKESYEKIHAALDNFKQHINFIYPKELFEFVPGSVPTKEQRKEVFEQNLLYIHASSFVIVNTEEKDIGTLFEAGYAYGFNKKIVYVCLSLGDENFNLMLAESAFRICTKIEHLEEIIKRIVLYGIKSIKPFSGNIKIE